MEDRKIIDSPLSCRVEQDGISVQVRIYRLKHTEWALEIVAEDGTSTVWDDLFASDEDARDEAMSAIETDGILSFNADEAIKVLLH